MRTIIQELIKMKRFELIEHTADVGIVAYGGSLEEVFANAAYGMFSIITNVNMISQKKSSGKIRLERSSVEELLVAWLNELLYYVNEKKTLFSKFDIRIEEDILKAKAYGEKLNASKHMIKREIKAATYHQLALKRMVLADNSIRWQAEVIFDV